MSLLDRITDPEAWEEFYEYKKNGGHFFEYEERELRAFIDSRRYMKVAEAINSGADISLPALVELNKKSTGKKRKVFVFPRAENYVFKLLAYMLSRKYDYLFTPNLYSFRQRIGVKNAIRHIVGRRDIGSLYSYKVDIHDYFNSINTDSILKKARQHLSDDEPVLAFIERVLREPRARFEGEIIECRKGIMAGVPISGFLANIYLADLDRAFFEKGLLYARYSDDIITFASTEEEIAASEAMIKQYLSDNLLTVNEKKEFRTAPGEPWEFLGFSITGKEIDISTVSLEKLKGKMRRKARSLVRWRCRKNASPDGAAKAFVRMFNRKLYDNPRHNDITWSLWYFPSINTDKSLHVLDEYAIRCIRYIYTGRHSKINYRLRYSRIKSYGFRSLVNEYYKFKKSEDTQYIQS